MRSYQLIPGSATFVEEKWFPWNASWEVVPHLWGDETVWMGTFDWLVSSFFCFSLCTTSLLIPSSTMRTLKCESSTFIRKQKQNCSTFVQISQWVATHACEYGGVYPRWLARLWNLKYTPFATSSGSRGWQTWTCLSVNWNWLSQLSRGSCWCWGIKKIDVSISVSNFKMICCSNQLLHWCTRHTRLRNCVFLGRNYKSIRGSKFLNSIGFSF